MDSHEWAQRQMLEASYLLGKPRFEMPQYTGLSKNFIWFMLDKEGFVAAVRALGAGEKKTGTEYVEYHPTDAPIYIRIEREQVCKLVRPAEYDCEPFLKEDDHKIIDAASQIPVDSPPF